MILCLETSTAYCSVALSREQDILAIRESKQEMDHASVLIPNTESCLREARITVSQLEAVCINVGPGSFTGLRVGLSTAKGMCFGLGIPLIGLSGLKVLAMHCRRLCPGAAYYCAMIKARENEVYAAILDDSGNVFLEDQVIQLSEDWHFGVLGKSDSIVFCGDGVEAYQNRFCSIQLSFCSFHSSAALLSEPGRIQHEKKSYSDAKKIRPNYLKSPHITQARKAL